jgi:methionyl-tRNA synthetase
MTYYVTTPIYYVNDLPHIGHTYTTVVADVLARFHRQCGDEVRFLTGTDEHGQKIERAARARGLQPLQLADQVVERFRSLWTALGIRNDDFIRTTEPRHRKGVEALFAKIHAKGDIYQDRYAGWYCTSCESFYPENQIVDGRCPDQGHKVEWTEEESYFFRLSRYQEPLLRLYRERPDFVFPETRRNEVVAFVESGLKDLSISRSSFSWGLPFPGDPKHVLYVWFDALSNYITALGYGEGSPLYRRFWPGIHLVGKDILRFHAVYWPAFLMSAGEPLPKQVVAHGWWLRDAAKISKSAGGVVDPLPLLHEFGADALRYFLLREMAFGQDASYSDEAFIERVNTDLANDLGNLASRTLKMIEDYRGGLVPSPDPAFAPAAALAEAARGAASGIRREFETYAFHAGLQRLWDFVGALNRFLVQQEPWILARDPKRAGELDSVLYAAAEGLRHVAVLSAPVIPAAAARLWRAVGAAGEVDAAPSDALRWGDLQPGSRIARGPALFPRIDKAAYLASGAVKERSMERSDDRTRATQAVVPPAAPARTGDGTSPAAATSPAGTPPSPSAAPGAAPGAAAGLPAEIGIEDFQRVELRTAKVLAAEKVQGADRLLKLTVDIGREQRTIVAGIALRYAPETLIGRTIVVVANLKPAKLRGVMSQGMLLAASDESGQPFILTTEDPNVRAGWRVK